MSTSAKRRRIDGQFSPKIIYPEEFDVNRARKANDLRLKSRFESIFEKYGRDFSAVGDEIDLANGAIVVDNGHLTEMCGEHDVGRGLWDDFHPEDESEDNNTSVNVTALPGTVGDAQKAGNTFQNLVMKDDSHDLAGSKYGSVDGLSTGNADQSTNARVLSHHKSPSVKERDNPVSITTSPKAMANKGILNDEDNDRLELDFFRDTLWDAPPLPLTALATAVEDLEFTANNYTERTPSPINFKSIWATPHSRRRRIPKIHTPKNVSKRAPNRKPKADTTGSDSDDPIQDSTPISRTPGRLSHTNTKASEITPSWTATPRRRTPIPIQEEQASSPEHSEFNEISVEEQRHHSETTSPIRKSLSTTPVRHDRILEIKTPCRQNVVIADQADKTIGEKCSTDKSYAGALPSKSMSKLLTPQELKELVTLRLVQRKTWREISSAIPSRPSVQLRQWYYTYCSVANRNLPIFEAWTHAEREKLGLLELDDQVTWDIVQSTFSDKSLDDIQLEWVKACVGYGPWETWIQSRSPTKAKMRQSAHGERFTQTPSRNSGSNTSPAHSSKSPAIASETTIVTRTQSIPTSSRIRRDESPDPLSEAFEEAWLRKGLSGVQISTPPKAFRSARKQTKSG